MWTQNKLINRGTRGMEPLQAARRNLRLRRPSTNAAAVRRPERSIQHHTLTHREDRSIGFTIHVGAAAIAVVVEAAARAIAPNRTFFRRGTKVARETGSQQSRQPSRQIRRNAHETGGHGRGTRTPSQARRGPRSGRPRPTSWPVAGQRDMASLARSPPEARHRPRARGMADGSGRSLSFRLVPSSPAQASLAAGGGRLAPWPAVPASASASPFDRDRAEEGFG